MAQAAAADFLPLTEAVYHILLALYGEHRHGYAILRDVQQRTDGTVKLRTGTLYTAIRRLLEQGLIDEYDERPADDDERRRYYGLTDLGRAVVGAEAERLRGMVEMAREKKILADAGARKA